MPLAACMDGREWLTLRRLPVPLRKTAHPAEPEREAEVLSLH